jgi:hypothetical protein
VLVEPIAIHRCYTECYRLPVWRGCVAVEIAQRRSVRRLCGVFDTGDGVVAALGRFIPENEIEAASITAIGAFRDALVGGLAEAIGTNVSAGVSVMAEWIRNAIYWIIEMDQRAFGLAGD